MRMARSKTGLAAVLVVGSLIWGVRTSPGKKKALASNASSPVSVAEFQQLHGKLVGMSTQRVWSIPWQLSVRKARELAAKEKRPVFLWISSNGGTHPLGPC